MIYVSKNKNCLKYLCSVSRGKSARVAFDSETKKKENKNDVRIRLQYIGPHIHCDNSVSCVDPIGSIVSKLNLR